MPAAVGPRADHRAEVADRAGLAAADQQRLRMAGAQDLGGLRGDMDQRDRARASARARSVSARLSWCSACRGSPSSMPGGAQRVARLRGLGGGLGAAAGDVADQQHPARGRSGTRRRSRRRRGSPRPPGGTGWRARRPGIAGSASGSRPFCSVWAMCERSRYRRAFSTALPARRPSSSASSRSARLNARPDSALTNESTPIARPPVTIGTIITARMPRLLTSSRCSGSGDGLRRAARR